MECMSGGREGFEWVVVPANAAVRLRWGDLEAGQKSLRHSSRRLVNADRLAVDVQNVSVAE